MEIICKNCGNKQEYKLRNKKIPNRPKTQCKNCQKWIYIDSSLLTKNVDQKNDQIIDQINKKHDNIVSKSKITDIHSSLTKNVDQKNDQIIDQINKLMDNIVSKSKITDIHSSLTKNVDQINKKIVPEHIIIAWNDLAPSIGSAFSKRKWPTKNKMFTIFDNWMKSLLEE